LQAGTAPAFGLEAPELIHPYETFELAEGCLSLPMSLAGSLEVVAIACLKN